jgi:hypothetical protein
MTVRVQLLGAQDELIGGKLPKSTLTLTLDELVFRQSPAGKNVSMEAEDILGIRHQATTGEETAA